MLTSRGSCIKETNYKAREYDTEIEQLQWDDSEA